MAPTLATALALLAVVSAGCTDTAFGDDEEPGSGRATYAIAGTFTQAATQAEMDELGAKARELGGDMVVMESFPAQFRATGLDATGCDGFRVFAEGRSYVADVGSCALQPSK